jgi:hypothetical protein
MEKEKYKIENWRRIDHGTTKDVNSHCRHCNWGDLSTSESKAKKHSKETGHTVDIYKERWIEMTCYKKIKN